MGAVDEVQAKLQLQIPDEVGNSQSTISTDLAFDVSIVFHTQWQKKKSQSISIHFLSLDLFDLDFWPTRHFLVCEATDSGSTASMVFLSKDPSGSLLALAAPCFSRKERKSFGIHFMFSYFSITPPARILEVSINLYWGFRHRVRLARFCFFMLHCDVEGQQA